VCGTRHPIKQVTALLRAVPTSSASILTASFRLKRIQIRPCYPRHEKPLFATQETKNLDSLPVRSAIACFKLSCSFYALANGAGWRAVRAK
jgi:hypothetical protein